MKYCECDKPFSVLKLRPFLHVRLVRPTGKTVYLIDVNQVVMRAGKKRCWAVSTSPTRAYIFHSLAEAKKGTKVPVMARKDGSVKRVEISCRHCSGVVWPKSVLVQIAELVGEEDSGL